MGDGSVTVTGVSAACSATSATVSGTSATAANARFGAFSAACSSTGPSSGSVKVINGGIPAGTYTTFQSYADPATGAQLHLNGVSGTPGGPVTRTAIQLHASDGAVASIGQVVCNSGVYPLAVDVAAPATGTAAAPPAIGAGSSGRPSNVALLAGGIAALLVALGGFALWVRRRRADVAGG